VRARVLFVAARRLLKRCIKEVININIYIIYYLDVCVHKHTGKSTRRKRLLLCDSFFSACHVRMCARAAFRSPVSGLRSPVLCLLSACRMDGALHTDDTETASWLRVRCMCTYVCVLEGPTLDAPHT